MRTGKKNMQWKIISERELCVFVFCMGGWTIVFVHGKISGSGCGWKTATLSHPLLDLVRTHSCFIWITYITTHTHTQAAQKQPVKRKEAGEVEEGREGEQERGVLGSQRIELFWDSTLFSAILTDRGEAVTSGGRETGRRSQTYTHMRVTPASGVCHECIIVCYFTAAAEVLWLLLKSLWAAWSLCISELRFLTQMCERSQRNEA